MKHKARLVIEFDINDEDLKDHGISADTLLKRIVISESDVFDGFEITTAIDGIDCAESYFLRNGKIVSREY